MWLSIVSQHFWTYWSHIAALHNTIIGVRTQRSVNCEVIQQHYITQLWLLKHKEVVGQPTGKRTSWPKLWKRDYTLVHKSFAQLHPAITVHGLIIQNTESNPTLQRFFFFLTLKIFVISDISTILAIPRTLKLQFKNPKSQTQPYST